MSFYQRKEIKDVLAYLRLVINPGDEEALKRIINFPARGIGQATMDKLTVAANQSGKTIFEVILEVDRLGLGLHGGTRTKLQNFANMIRSFQIMNEGADAFTLAEHVARKTGLLLEFKKDGTPEGIARMENIEELLNGIKDFVEGQKEIVDAKGDLTEFLEDVALATDMDREVGDDDRVALMTIHLAKRTGGGAKTFLRSPDPCRTTGVSDLHPEPLPVGQADRRRAQSIPGGNRRAICRK